jgi:drug/metabolite transporter (DMT)-like permease
MTTLALSLILFSGVMHAFWNLLVKRSRHKTVFIWWMFLCSTLLFTLLLLFVPGPFPRPDLRIIILGGCGAVCFFLYHLFNGRAYRHGDLSLTYPLSQTSMLYVPLWGILFMNETISLVGAGGIFLIIAGAYAVQLRSLSFSEVVRPFRNLKDPSVQAALVAGFVYSLGAVVDKTGVQDYSPFHFTYILVIFMLALMTLNLLQPRYRLQVSAEWKNSRGLILASGPVMMASFLSFRYGLSLAPMSYAVLVRQMSVLVGVFIGIAFLGEPCGRMRMFSAFLIIAGITLIRFG